MTSISMAGWYSPTVAYSSTASSASVWAGWNNASVTSYTTSASAWDSWNQQFAGRLATSATLAASEAYWVHWNRGLQQQGFLQDTPEQAQARMRQAEERREAAVRAEGERAAARERAEVLLHENLSPVQLAELRAAGHFHLETVAPSGERRRYRIERGRSRNVKQVTAEGRVIKTLCAHPAEEVPDADTMLAQKLFLECSEEEFLRVANHS